METSIQKKEHPKNPGAIGRNDANGIAWLLVTVTSGDREGFGSEDFLGPKKWALLSGKHTKSY